MIFETLWKSAQHGELMLIDGGMCHWHLRRDGVLTIHEIIATRPGAGSEMLTALLQVPRAHSITAKCPCDLASNNWYRKKGFQHMRTEKTKTGRDMNVWTLFKRADDAFSEPTMFSDTEER